MGSAEKPLASYTHVLRKKWPIAPDGFIPNSVIRKVVHPPTPEPVRVPSPWKLKPVPKIPDPCADDEWERSEVSSIYSDEEIQTRAFIWDESETDSQSTTPDTPSGQARAKSVMTASPLTTPDDLDMATSPTKRLKESRVFEMPKLDLELKPRAKPPMKKIAKLRPIRNLGGGTMIQEEEYAEESSSGLLEEIVEEPWCPDTEPNLDEVVVTLIKLMPKVPPHIYKQICEYIVRLHNELGYPSDLMDVVVDSLMGDLTRENVHIRVYAVRTLGQLGLERRTVILGLLPLLIDEEGEIRQAAVSALGQLTGIQNKDHLMDLLDNLTNFGGRPQSARPTHEDVIGSLSARITPDKPPEGEVTDRVGMWLQQTSPVREDLPQEEDAEDDIPTIPVPAATKPSKSRKGAKDKSDNVEVEPAKTSKGQRSPRVTRGRDLRGSRVSSQRSPPVDGSSPGSRTRENSRLTAGGASLLSSGQRSKQSSHLLSPGGSMHSLSPAPEGYDRSPSGTRLIPTNVALYKAYAQSASPSPTRTFDDADMTAPSRDRTYLSSVSGPRSDLDTQNFSISSEGMQRASPRVQTTVPLINLPGDYTAASHDMLSQEGASVLTEDKYGSLSVDEDDHQSAPSHGILKQRLVGDATGESDTGIGTDMESEMQSVSFGPGSQLWDEQHLLHPLPRQLHQQQNKTVQSNDTCSYEDSGIEPSEDNSSYYGKAVPSLYSRGKPQLSPVKSVGDMEKPVPENWRDFFDTPSAQERKKKYAKRLAKKEMREEHKTKTQRYFDERCELVPADIGVRLLHSFTMHSRLDDRKNDSETKRYQINSLPGKLSIHTNTVASGSSKFGVLEMHWMTGMPGNDGIKPQRSHHAWDQRSRQSRQWSGCEDQSVPGRDPLSIPIPQLARLRQLRTGQQQHSLSKSLPDSMSSYTATTSSRQRTHRVSSFLPDILRRSAAFEWNHPMPPPPESLLQRQQRENKENVRTSHAYVCQYARLAKKGMHQHLSENNFILPRIILKSPESNSKTHINKNDSLIGTYAEFVKLPMIGTGVLVDETGTNT